jgi:GMP reductase
VPKIDNEVKLDFKDVLIKPRVTDLSSRKEVSLKRKFSFRHHNTTWEGIPIMSANMDTTGTFEIA